jgi:hypothetical protein
MHAKQEREQPMGMLFERQSAEINALA